VVKIGNIIKKKKLIVLDKDNKEIIFNNLGFQHF